MAREISAGIIIYKRMKDRDNKIETKYLLLYHGRGYWNFPKGKIEKDERSYQTALREVGEETGIPSRLLRVENNFKMTDKYVFQFDGKKVFKIVIFFLAQSNRSEINLSYEQEGYGWFLYKDALRLLKHKNSRIMLKRSHDYLQNKSLRNSKKNTQG